ncbi:MAG: hypothetical protein QW244_00045 [Candidatus Pacearchaeota archaeon]
MKTKIIASLVMTVFLLSVLSIASEARMRGDIENATEMVKTRSIEKVKEYIRAGDIESIKDQVKACQENITEECQAIRVEALSFVKNRFVSMIDTSIERLEKVKEIVEKSKKYSEEEKAGILKSIDEAIANLRALKERAPELSASELKEEIKRYRAQRELFQDKTKLEIEKVKAERIGLIVEKAEALVAKLNKFLEKYNVSEEEKAELSAKIDEFNKLIEAAKKNKEEAMQLWLGLKQRLKTKNATAQEIRETIRAVHEKLEEAKKNLKEAKEVLKEIVFEVKGIEQISKEEREKSKEKNETKENETEAEQGNETQVEVEVEPKNETVEQEIEEQSAENQTEDQNQTQ